MNMFSKKSCRKHVDGFSAVRHFNQILTALGSCGTVERDARGWCLFCSKETLQIGDSDIF